MRILRCEAAGGAFPTVAQWSGSPYQGGRQVSGADGSHALEFRS